MKEGRLDPVNLKDAMRIEMVQGAEKK
ncbi:hypothetical protein PBAL39_07485 [Pedobacter sp. BAL39]|nr:hypothetical protein PBAL39_07485 [Pedobacter sp. BAL39]